MTTLSLEASKKVYELVGEYESSQAWVIWHPYSLVLPGPSWSLKTIPEILDLPDKEYIAIPAPTFAELIRVLVRIGEKIKSDDSSDDEWNRLRLVKLYQDAPTEPKGMKACEDYLMKLL